MSARAVAEHRTNNTPPSDKPAAAVQSVDRALAVLEILGHLGTAGVTEIASRLNVHKSTISRLITVLESRGFVEQLADRGKYRLGFALIRLAGSTGAQLDLAKKSQPICDALANQSRETVNIAVLDGDRIINIVEATGSSDLTIVRTWIGQNCPAHATASGKVLLAAAPPDQLHTLLHHPLTQLTPTTITDPATLDTELAQSRRNGWSSMREELELGLNAVSAPIRDHTTKVIAALSISGPTHRLPPTQFQTMATLAITAANQISQRLGYQNWSTPQAQHPRPSPGGSGFGGLSVGTPFAD